MSLNLKSAGGGGVILSPASTGVDINLTVPATSSTLLTQADGASNAVYIPSGTGAVATTVQAKLRESVSVKDFGAVGDGVTDDSAAIATAYAASTALFFPPGTYKVSTSLTLTSDNFIFQGVRGKSIIKVSGNISAFNVATQYASQYGVIDGLTFDSFTAGQGTGIYSPSSVYVSHWKISECTFHGRLAYGINATLIGCWVLRCAFAVNVSSTSMIAINSVGQTTPTDASSNINTFEQCEIAHLGSPTYGVVLGVGAVSIFKQCIFESFTPTVAAIQLKGLTHVEFDGCWLESCCGTSFIETTLFNGTDIVLLTMNNCLIQTGVVVPNGIINFSTTSNRYLVFTNNELPSLQSPIITGGNTVAKFIAAYGNYATVAAGGDATGLNFNSPAKFDLGISALVAVTTPSVVTPAISFPVAQVSSADANTLDDYEEGAWTPTDISGAALSLTVSGYYTKIGRVVTFSGTVVYPVTASGSNASISKPPFANLVEGSMSVLSNSGVTLQAALNGTGIIFYPAGSFANTTNATLSGKTVYVTGTYMTAT